MIEYLYDAIRAESGHELDIVAVITDSQGAAITENCNLLLHDEDAAEVLYTAPGTFVDELGTWQFTVPANITKDLKGRFWYCVRHEHESMCFKQPLYLR